MAIPTQPTETSIVTKSYRLYGKSPTSTELTEAISDGIAMVKSDLMNSGREWSFLRRTAYKPMAIGVSRIQAPTDYSKLISAVLLDGVRSGTAQAGTSTTITLAAADNGGAEDSRGKILVIKSGTGSEQALQIKSFDASTKVATMEEAWTTTPDSSSTYLVADDHKELHLQQIWNFDELQLPFLSGAPVNIYHQTDDVEGDFKFDYTPDKEYVVQLRYYSDLRKEDTDTGTNTRYATILRKLEQVLVQGVLVWLLQDDGRVQFELPKYSRMLALTEGQFLYPNNARQKAELAEDAY